jgi:pimeloyl-ACP methyl ester carboxylesterase
LLTAGLIGNLLLALACIAPKQTPNLERIFAQARGTTGKRPIIVIPGILGTQLIDSKTGDMTWPSVLRSKDGDSLPMTPDLAANRDDIVPGKIIETLKLARVLPEVYVYRDLLDALRKYGGYREADWANPGAAGDRDAFYVFAYDWRRDIVENARDLVRRIDALKQKLGRPDLRFNILAHSMGGLIARYAAMYGDADLPTSDVAPQLTWAGAGDINKIVLLGVPNEGSADAFTTLLFGYSITEGLRRRIPLLDKLTAEDAVATPSVFQLMPHQQVAKFLGEDLKPLPIDLYDAATWKRYGWSPINDPEYRRRYQGNVQSDHSSATKGSLEMLDGYLAAVLQRAHRLHLALDAVADKEPKVILLAIGGDCEETLNAPILLRDSKSDRWLTLIKPQDFRTSTGARVTKRETLDAMFAPGDGRVTRRSLLGLDLASGNRDGADSPLRIAYTVFGCELHGTLQRNKVLEDNALTALVGEVMR